MSKKKAPAKKPAAKKVVAKKTVVKKPVAKKVVAKKTAAKKTVAKPVAKKTVAKPNKKLTPAVKKPLAPVAKSSVKPTTAATASKPSRITPIKAPQPVPTQPRSAANKNSMTPTIVPAKYEPTDKEEFMNPVMKEYFRQRLHAWRDELLRESELTLNTLHEEGNMQKPDITDRASEETDLAIEFRTRDRERKLLNKINEAVGRIEDGSYGYCEETGDPIPVKRLTARPTATRTIEAEEMHERRERTQRDQYE